MKRTNRTIPERQHNTSNFSKTKRSEERVPMPAGTILPITGTDIMISRDGSVDEYSSGSTCLVYRGHILSGTGVVTGMQVIIKEFYPFFRNNPSAFSRQENGSLCIDKTVTATESYKKIREQFLNGLEYQKELAGSNAMEISIRPLFICDWGSSTYIISDAHNGADLETDRAETLQEIISVAVSFSESMGILHENGYIMTDIKADNFLWTRKPNTVRIIDTDSLVPFRDVYRMSLKPLFANKNHFSPELEFLYAKMLEGTSGNEMTMLKKNMLTPNADRYAMGVFLFELLFGRLPDLEGRDSCLQNFRRRSFGRRSHLFRQSEEAYCLPRETEADTQLLVEELTNRFQKDLSAAADPASSLLQPLLTILQRLLIRSPLERMRRGYQDDDAIVSDLQTVYAQLTSKKLVLRRETAKANARFAAYNLLQKYPLFDYQAVSNERPVELSPENDKPSLPYCKHELGVAIIGQHAMRSDMLSAVLSIGQMPDLPLHISLIASDAEIFWLDYISPNHNPALARAVIWENNEMFDPSLVDRPLANLTICTQDAPGEIPNADSQKSRILRAAYYIILEEDPAKRNDWIRALAACAFLEQKKIFIGYLSLDHETAPAVSAAESQFITFYTISAEAFTENYSEKMFSEKIYTMGLMAHAYYNKSMEDESSDDHAAAGDSSAAEMKSLEEQFRSDMYSITSSERCALHAAYKMAGLGIDRNRPGRFLRYYRKTENPACLEELAWIEHLSWTAFMLTSGAVPVSMDEFDTYAYHGENDWKDKTDSRHLRHPLLVASARNARLTLRDYARAEEITPEIFENLDPLDQVSVQITRWYASQREQFRQHYLQWLGQLSEACLNSSSSPVTDIGTLLASLKESGLACIAEMGTTFHRRDPVLRQSWEEAADQLCSLQRDQNWKRILELMEAGVKTIMRPVFDSLNDRDFKQYDRDLAYAVIDMIA